MYTTQKRRFICHALGGAVVWMTIAGMGCTVEETVERENSSAMNFCAIQEGESHEHGVEAGEELDLYAVFSCGAPDWQLAVSQCDVEDVEGSFAVTTYFEFFYETERWGDHATSDFCSTFYADCGSIGPLEDGNYELHHGDDDWEFSVPSDEVMDCRRYGDEIETWRERN